MSVCRDFIRLLVWKGILFAVLLVGQLTQAIHIPGYDQTVYCVSMIALILKQVKSFPVGRSDSRELALSSEAGAEFDLGEYLQRGAELQRERKGNNRMERCRRNNGVKNRIIKSQTRKVAALEKRNEHLAAELRENTEWLHKFVDANTKCHEQKDLASDLLPGLTRAGQEGNAEAYSALLEEMRSRLEK